jgi:predicted RNase H-like HicB family nuclease
VRAAASLQDGAIFLTAAMTGLRRGELVALRWRDVDFTGQAIRVRANYSFGELVTPKSGKVRTVPMVPDVAEALARSAQTKAMSEYLVVIEHEADSWGAYCPDLPGLGVVADTRAEVEQLIREAFAFHLEGLREAGDPIPPPSAVDTTLVEVPAA